MSSCGPSIESRASTTTATGSPTGWRSAAQRRIALAPSSDLRSAATSPRRSPRSSNGPSAALSVERDDDLAVGAALLDVRQRLEGLVERERLVDDRAEVAGVVEGGQLAQLGAVGLHEQERVAHAQLPRLLADLAAQQPHHDAHELRRPELPREPGVRRAGDADRLSARLDDGEGLLEVLAT